MHWRLSNHADPLACALADEHYSRKTVGAPQMMPPGRKLVLLSEDNRAVWGTSWPFPEYVFREWADAWLCSIFRRLPGCQWTASELIREAIACTRWRYGDAPALGMVTLIDRGKVRPTMVRGKEVWGWTYRKAGFVEAVCPEHGGADAECAACRSETKGGHLVLQLWPAAMPDPLPPLGAQLGMLLEALV